MVKLDKTGVRQLSSVRVRRKPSLNVIRTAKRWCRTNDGDLGGSQANEPPNVRTDEYKSGQVSTDGHWSHSELSAVSREPHDLPNLNVRQDGLAKRLASNLCEPAAMAACCGHHLGV